MTQPTGIARLEFVNESTVLNGSVLNGGQGSYTLVKAEGMKRSSADAGLGDMDCDDSDSDSDSLNSAQQQQLHLQQAHGNNGIKPGKKTKGRVKIKMEFIENKLRRYTTFSKRKTGIMKKAYELSTLTGTQVMLLVASETGHVYTFATRKLQPMITSESGKALIQTCLNSPDTPPTAPGQQQAVEQRMNPTGFEETELSYAVGDEEQQKDSMVPSKSTSGGYCHVQQSPSQSPSPVSASSSPTMNPTVSSPQTMSMTAYVTPTTTSSQSSQRPANLSMHLPGGITVLPPGGEAQSILNYMQGLPPGTPISIPVSQASSGPQQQQQQQAVYRFPTPQPGQIVSLQGIPQSQPQNLVKVTESSSSSTSSSQQQQQQQHQQQLQQQQQQNITMIQGTSQTPMMYHTSQGLVYATAAGTAVGANIPEGFILNLPQTSPLQLTQDQQNPGGQQYITIPVPLSMAHGGATQQMFQTMLAQTGSQMTAAGDAQRSPVERSGKR